jgi:hypothetical protein
MDKITQLHQSPRLFELYSNNSDLFAAVINMAIDKAASEIGRLNFAHALCAEHHSQEEKQAA